MTNRRSLVVLSAGAAVLAAGIALNGAYGARVDERRDADRTAIRAHIDRIFKAYIAKDRAGIEATHDREWRGFLTSSRRMVRGIGEYMQNADAFIAAPSRMVAYAMEDLDVQFRGPDIAIVSYIAELEGEREHERRTWKLRVVDVYERQRGEWMQVASNTAMHPQSTAEQTSELQPMPPSERSELLKAREAVWRAWFGGDQAALGELLPSETIALSAGPHGWSAREAILEASRAFSSQGNRLVKLAFPRSEIQSYGATAIIYTTYEYETERAGKRALERGKAIEVFVRRQDGWVNTGWNMTADPAAESE